MVSKNTGYIRRVLTVTQDYGEDFKSFLKDKTSSRSLRAELYATTDRALKNGMLGPITDDGYGISSFRVFEANHIVKTSEWSDYSWNLFLDKDKFPSLSKYYDSISPMLKTRGLLNLFYEIYFHNQNSMTANNDVTGTNLKTQHENITQKLKRSSVLVE